MVADAVVVELDLDPHEVVARLQLEGGAHLDACGAGAGAVGDVGGQRRRCGGSRAGARTGPASTTRVGHGRSGVSTTTSRSGGHQL